MNAASAFHLVALLAGVMSCSLGIARADWQLAWSDEFNGSSLDSNHWVFDLGNGSGGWGNNELEYYTSRPQNVYVTNGLLHITAIKESYSGFNYTSAKLKSIGLFSQKYGRFEFYAKLPSGQGYWPAFWMMPEDAVYGGWAASGEIDVMENRGSNPANVLGTIHYGGMYPHQAQSSGPSFTFPAEDSVTNFHLYAVEWTDSSIRWYVDDQLYETQTSWWSSSNPTNTSIRNPYPAPFDQPFYLIMNLAVGGNFGGNPDTNTIFPGEIQVDYVRAYSWIPVPPPAPILKLQLPFNDATGSTVTSSQTNDGGVSVTLQMMNSAGNAADYHGATNSGVAGTLTGNRALNFSVNNPSQPNNPGPLAAVTNVNLGFGTMSNFVVSLWFKQNAMMADGANLGPRLFVLGTGTPTDSGVAGSIGLKFQIASQLYFQLGSATASVSFPQNVPTNTWLFIAAVYDGVGMKIYQGTETNSVSLIATAPATTNINFGTSGALYLGNRQDRQRSFNGWLDDFRFYSGVGDSNFVESIRQSAVNPALNLTMNLSPAVGTNGLKLNWSNGILQSAASLSGPWSNVDNAVPPFDVLPKDPQRYYRVRFP